MKEADIFPIEVNLDLSTFQQKEYKPSANTHQASTTFQHEYSYYSREYSRNSMCIYSDEYSYESFCTDFLVGEDMSSRCGTHGRFFAEYLIKHLCTNI